MTEREIRMLRDKIGIDPILTDEEIEYIWMAVDKQIPVKPIYDHRYAEMGCEFCGNIVSGREESPDYCPQCGQAIDWED